MKKIISSTALFSTTFLVIALLFVGGMLMGALSITTASVDATDSKGYDWYFSPKKDHSQPAPIKEVTFLKKYPAYYVGDPSKKVIYLTFDAGYENGNNAKILDVLKNKKVNATFFVAGNMIKREGDLVRRMVNEGHIVGNHSQNHNDMSKITNFEAYSAELKELENSFKQLTGKDLPKYFRPPMGKFSELSLEYDKRLGYKTIFWSFAYVDWLENDQPTHTFAKDKIFSRTHNGCIMLLHSTSKTNAEILGNVIDSLREQGYEFHSLDTL